MIISACFALLVSLAPQDVVVRGEFGKKLDRIVQTSTNGAFWGVVLVARGDEVLLSKGYGNADYGEVPNTPRTLFEIASTSKMFTAAAILKLEMEGKLNTDDPISKHFADAPEDKKAITIRHLLTHTAGIDDEKAALPYATTSTRDEMVKHVLTSPLCHAPGEQFEYSNFGYALLAALVEKASGEPFETYVKKNIFEPAGMRETGFINDEALDPKRAAARLASNSIDGSSLKWNWSWGYRGMGGVVTTAHDLLKWHRCLKGADVLSADAKAKYVTPFKSDYAFGWMIEKTSSGQTKIHHGGGVAGFRTQFARFIEDDVVIVILSNETDQLFDIEKKLGDALFPSEIEAVLNLKGRTLSQYRAFESDALKWKAEKRDKRIVLTLRDSDKEPALAEITMPPAAARSLAEKLEAVVNDKAKSDATGMDAGVYTYAYAVPDDDVLKFSGLDVDVMPKYVGVKENGEEVTDDRPTLVLVDAEKHNWPLMAKMSVAVAKSLADEIKKALER